MNKLLVLDLDETLVYATNEKLDRQPDFYACGYKVFKRPHLNQFLNFCFEHFRVGVWTSSSTGYASQVVKNIFHNQNPEFVYTYGKCTLRIDFELQDYYTVKKLKKLKKFASLSKVIMVDNTPKKLEDNYGNIVRVNDYTGEEKDQELIYLSQYLLKLKEAENIRTVEKRLWRNEVGYPE